MIVRDGPRLTAQIGPKPKPQCAMCNGEVGVFAIGDGRLMGWGCLNRAAERAEFVRVVHVNEHKSKVPDCRYCEARK